MTGASGSLAFRALALLSPRERLGAVALAAVTIVAGLIEASIVVLVFPIVYAVVDPDSFAASALGKAADKWLALLGAENPVLWMLLATICLLLAAAALRLATVYASEVHGAVCRQRLARSILDRVVDAPAEWSMQRRTAEHMTLVVQDVDSWRGEYIQSLLSCVQSGFLVLFPVVAVVALASTTGLAAIAAVGLLVALFVAVCRPIIRRTSAAEIRVRDIATRHLLQTLNGLREVKLSTYAGVFVATFARENARSAELHLKARFVSAVPGVGISTLGQIGFLAAVFLVWSTEKSAADAALNLALMGILVARVLPAFNAFGNHVTQLAKSAPNVERILASLASLDAAIAAARRPAPVPFPDGWRQLRVRGVGKRFSADRNPALVGVDFAFERGKVYGLVGRSGAGKTTLANILVGLAEPSEGEVLFDDVRLRDVEIAEWYARIGYVPQASFVLDASVAENVAFGAPIDEARVAAAIAEARLASVVTAMDDAARGSLGERGGKLSGGQIQRLAIARAIYRRPQFMMFDEATSALDQETEREVQQVLADRSVSRLTIIIAHRVKTLTVCDEILFLEDGRLLGAGPFETLKRTVPAFQAMLNAADAEPAAPGILP